MSPGVQPAWKPPDSDRQAATWKPPTGDRPVEPQRPGESRLAYLMRIPAHVDSSRIDAQMEADKADFRQIGEGVSSAVHANTADEAAGGASTALRGGMKIAAKALPAIAPMMPVATVGGLAAGTAGSLVGQAGASAAGAGPGTSSLAGDIAGILAGGMGARLANAAAKILVHPSVLPKLIRILPKGQAMVDAATAIRDVARPPAPPAPPAAPPVAAPPPPASPGQILAESQGMDWAKLNPGDQALLETAARAQANTAAQPAPRPATQPQQAPAAPPQPAPAQQGMTAADLIQQEFAAKRIWQEFVAKQESDPQPPQPLQGGHPAARIVPKGNVPVRPPLRQPEPPNVQPAPEAAAIAPQPPPARTLPQVEAAMAQRAPAPLEPPTSRYSSTGEKKSPQLRAAEITGANAEAKAMRFAEALDKYDISPEDARQIQTGRVSNDQIGKGVAPKWENVTDDLVAKGLLPAGEKPPVQSLPIIVKQLKRIRAERIARELADEMSKSGTIK